MHAQNTLLRVNAAIARGIKDLFEPCTPGRPFRQFTRTPLAWLTGVRKLGPVFANAGSQLFTTISILIREVEGKSLHAFKIIENEGQFHRVRGAKELTKVRLRVTRLVIPIEAIGIDIRVVPAQAQRQFIDTLGGPAVAQVTRIQIVALQIVNPDF